KQDIGRSFAECGLKLCVDGKGEHRRNGARQIARDPISEYAGLRPPDRASFRHRRAPSTACSVNLRSLAGVSGRSTGSMPNGASASAIALTSVGGPIMAPPSPTLLKPPTVFDGVVMCVYSNSGTSVIAG